MKADASALTRLIRLSFAILWPFCSCLASGAEPKINVLESRTEDGVLVRSFAVHGATQRPFFMATAEMKVDSFRFVLTNPDSPKALKEYSGEKGVVVAANVGWLETYNPPRLAGLQIFDGKLYNGIKHVDPNLNSVVCMDGDSVNILFHVQRLMDDFQDMPEEVKKQQDLLVKMHKNCIQTGPTLSSIKNMKRVEIDNSVHDNAVENFFVKHQGLAPQVSENDRFRTASRPTTRSFIGVTIQELTAA